MTCADVLIVVEDPGAANFVAPLAASLADDGMTVALLAGKSAASHLDNLGVDYRVLPKEKGVMELVQSYAPRLVVTGTSEDPDAYALALNDAARLMGIPSVGVVDGPANAAYRFRGRSEHALAHAPDFILVPDEAVRQSYIELGFAKDNVVTVGHPHFDTVLTLVKEFEREGRQEIRNRLFPKSKGKKLVVFLSELSTGLDPREFKRSDDYTLSGRGGNDGRSQIVFEEVVGALHGINEDVYFVVRLHPKEEPWEYDYYAGDFDEISAEESALEVVYAADLVVGMTTILMMESALMKCRTLSVLPRPCEAEWLPSSAVGMIPMVHDRKSLTLALHDALSGGADYAPPERDAPALSSIEVMTRFIHDQLRVGA